MVDEYRLAVIRGISGRKKRKLVETAGSAAEVFKLTERQIQQLQILTRTEQDALSAGKTGDAQRDYEALLARGIAFVSIGDADYPARLLALPDAPFGLYVRGRLPDKEKKQVAIVGARMCSEYGRATATELGRQLAFVGAGVISGMARGIDTAGHAGALLGGGDTCAVLGCGVDVCYPPSNRRLYGEILEKGCILSEYPPDTSPLPGYFPQRNRIIAGLSDIVVVVEARERSGSLITADCALEQGKEIYAVPGRICDPLSAGCNQLIRQGAGIVAGIDDFKKELGFCGGGSVFQESFVNLLLEKNERLVYSCVDFRPKSIEKLLGETALSMPELAEILERLTQKGFLTETFKNCYIRKI